MRVGQVLVVLVLAILLGAFIGCASIAIGLALLKGEQSEVVHEVVVVVATPEPVSYAPVAVQPTWTQVPYPVPAQETVVYTETPTPTPTITEVPVDWAEVVNIVAPSDVGPREYATVVIIIRNAGNVTWYDYSVQWKHGEREIEVLEPGGEAVLDFPIPSDVSTHGTVAFEFKVYNRDDIEVQWKPAGGLFIPPEPVANIRVWGYKDTDIALDDARALQKLFNESFGWGFPWRCEGGA